MASKLWLLVQWLDDNGGFSAYSSYGLVSVNNQAFNEAGLEVGQRTLIRVRQENAPQQAKILYISENKKEVQEQKVKVEHVDQQIQRVVRSLVGSNEDRDNLRSDNFLAEQQTSGHNSTPKALDVRSNNNNSSIDSDANVQIDSTKSGDHSKSKSTPQYKHQQSTGKQTRSTFNANDNRSIISSTPLPSTSARTDIQYSPQNKHQQSTSKQTRETSNANDNLSIISSTPPPSTSSARTDIPYSSQNKHQPSTSIQARSTPNANDNRSIISSTPLPSTSARTHVQYNPQNRPQQSTSKQTRDTSNAIDNLSIISRTPLPSTSAQKDKKTCFNQGSQTDRIVMSGSEITLLETELIDFDKKISDLMKMIYQNMVKSRESTSTTVGDEVPYIEQNVDEQNVDEQNVGEENVGEQNVNELNVGEQNVVEPNVGQQNVAEQNVGEQNVGAQNVGAQNEGGQNLSEQNVSEQNIDKQNVGEENVGEENVGEGNVGEHNAGVIEPHYFDNEEIGAEEVIENNDEEQQADLDLDQNWMVNAEQESNPNTRRVRRITAQTSGNIEHNMVPIGHGHARVSERLLNDIDWSMHALATRLLLQAVFPRSVLATHSLTGKKSRAILNKPAKKMLDPKLVEDIIETVSTNCDVTKKTVRNCISKNCAEEARLRRKRLKQKNARKAQDQNDENVSPSTSSSE